MDAGSRMKFEFAPWQQRAHAQAVEALAAGRLAHGLLFSGPAGLGQREVAEKLAQRVLCLSPRGDEACGTCRGCTLYQSRSQSDPVEIRPDGTLALPHGRPGHPDALFVGFAMNEKTGKPRQELSIEQIRTLSAQLALTSQYGEARVALIDPADALNTAASNALLKTLEEPQPGRYLWLIAADPSRLPATIRSRCQKLEFRLPPREEALAWLRTQGHAKAAEEALDAARGHPGLAAQWLADGSLDLRREVADDLRALSQGRASATATAQRWNADDSLALRLRFAADIALDAAGRLTDPMRTRRLAAWFAAANRTRDLLRTTVRADLAVAELLLDWPLGGAQGVVKAKA
jgi:DNA polymerase-3 subunit delta'